MDKTNGGPELAAKIKELESGNVKDSQGRLRRRSIYDENGQLLRYYALTYDENGVNDSVTSFDASGAMTGFVKLDSDRSDSRVVIAVQDGDVFVPEIQELDAEGRVVKRTRYYADSTVDFSEVYTYNENGQVEKVTREAFNPRGAPFGTRYGFYTYDEEGRTLREEWQDSDGNVTSCSAYEYHDHGWTLRENSLDPEGITSYSVFEYDSSGHVVEETLEWSFLDQENHWEHNTYEYDARGNLVRENWYRDHPSLGEELGGFRTYEYDSRNRLVKRSHFDENGVLVEYRIYWYNQADEQIGHKDYEGDGTLRESH